MSGFYLVVSNFRDEAVTEEFRPTAGGYPHVTAFHSQKRLDARTMLAVNALLLPCLFGAGDALPEFKLEATHVYVNSFEKDGATRHDVLCRLSDRDAGSVNLMRLVLDQSRLVDASSISPAQAPHVTHSIHWDQAAAEKAATHLAQKLPLTLRVTGAVFDK